MPIPSVVSIGAKASGLGSILVPLPTGLAVDHILLLVTGHSQVANPLTIPNGGGGTWTAIGGFGGQQSNPGVRGTWFWSRYNGTQTGITLSDTGGMQHARIVAISGCIATGSPIHGEIGFQPTFAETTSTLPALTTSSNDILILDTIVGELPDGNALGILINQISAGVSSAVIANKLLLAKNAGASWGRTDCLWYDVQPTQATFNWTTFDTVVNEYEAKGINLIAIVWGTPAWARGGVGTFTTPPDASVGMPGWSTFMTAMATRYGSRVAIYEMWNEPDHVSQAWTGTVAQYCNVLARGFNAVTAVNPALRVAFGGLANGGTHNDNFFTQALDDPTNPAGTKFHYVNEHFNGFTMAAMTTRLALRVTQLSSRGLAAREAIVTEIAYPSDPAFQTVPGYVGGGDATQQQYITDAFATLQGAGVRAITWAQLQEKNTDTGFYATDGLVREDNSLKPAYTTFQGLATPGNYSGWTNTSLSAQTELFDDASSAGTGGSFAMQAGGMPISGSTGTTTVTHASFRVVGKKIALTPAVVGPIPRFSMNPRGQILINGVPRLPLLIYDAGLPQFSSQYPEYLATTRSMARFTNKIDLYLNVQNGTLGNSLRFLDALGPYNMYGLTTGNALVVFDLTVPPPTGYDVHDNPTVSVPPVPAAPFRTQWAAHSRSFGTYLWDEPSYGPSFSGNPPRTLFTAQGRPTVFTPPDFVVSVNGVQKILNTDFTVQTHAGNFDGALGPNFSLTFNVAPPSGTFNIPVRFRYVFESMMYYHGQLKSQMPGQFTFGTLLNGDLGQYLEWADDPIGDTIGSDIYVIGQGPESGTGATYGYMNFNVGETAAMARYYALLNNKTPNVILQLNHFGATSRFITVSEIRSHCIAALTEFKGRGLLGWWALGVQNGAIHQEPFASATGNGTNTTFGYQSRVIDAADVWVDVAGNRLAANQFTVNGISQDTGYTVTLNVAPLNGQSVVVTNRSVGLATREIFLSTLETLCDMIKTLEPIMLTPDDPSLITNNSTWFATPVAWRINLLQLLSIGGSDKPAWNEGVRLLYVDELARLQQVPPDTSLSNYLLDQRGNVRTASWESASTGLVCAYNMQPNPQNNVTLQWHRGISLVQVLGESRNVPVNADGRSWTDTFGGASAKRQGPFDQAHVYQLTIADASGPSQGSVALTGGAAGRVMGTLLRPGSLVGG